MTAIRRALRFAFPAALLVLLAIAFSDQSAAFNQWNNEYRKWPWRAGFEHAVTTPPGQPPHTNETNTLAIDVGMTDDPVHSISGGTRISFGDVWCAGWTLTIGDLDGTYIKYKHLQPTDVNTSGEIVQGQIVAISGNTGSEDNVGIGDGDPTNDILCSDGPHLHFQRDSSSNPSTQTSLSLLPIGGETSV